jgi:hypothetical protein
MGRKPKVTDVQNEVEEQSNSAEVNMVELLMKQVQELQKQLESMNADRINPPVQRKTEKQIEEPKEEVRIDGREYIKVMSLSNIPLNLTTEPRGAGRLFQFEKFGEIKRIMYDDLVKVIYNHSNFMKSGRFFIMNRDVIRTHGYEEDYENILSKEKIEMILENKQNAIDLYNSTNDTQKKIIHELLTRKFRDNPSSVDMTLIMTIKKISDFDIIVEAESIKRSFIGQQN